MWVSNPCSWSRIIVPAQKNSASSGCARIDKTQGVCFKFPSVMGNQAECSANGPVRVLLIPPPENDSDSKETKWRALRWASAPSGGCPRDAKRNCPPSLLLRHRRGCLRERRFARCRCVRQGQPRSSFAAKQSGDQSGVLVLHQNLHLDAGILRCLPERFGDIDVARSQWPQLVVSAGVRCNGRPCILPSFRTNVRADNDSERETLFRAVSAYNTGL